MTELALVVLAAAAIGVGIWLRGRRRSGNTSNDALTRACSGDEEQARRLEDLEHRNAPEQLSRRAARQRALQRLIDDRGR